MAESTPTNSHESLLPHLSAEDQLRFVNALINPPRPNEALKRAMALHRENVSVDHQPTELK